MPAVTGPADDVAWLDEEELAAWLPLAPMMLLLPLELDRQLQRDSGLSLLEYYVMAGLSGSTDRTMRMSTVAQWTGAQLPRLSQVAARMESRGWISRSPDPTDGRYTLATLTDAGFAVLAAAAPGHVRTVRRLVLDPLTRSQVKQMGAIATRVLGAIHPDECFPPNRDA